MGGKVLKNTLVLGIIALFIVSAVSPMVIGYTSVVSEQKTPDEEYVYNRFSEHYYPERYSPVERDYLGTHSYDVKPDVVTESEVTTKTSLIEKKEDEKPQTFTSSGLVDSPWPMFCHDARHTGRSPYSTIDNSGFEKWKFETYYSVEGDVIIDNNGTIYFGSGWNLYALFLNGTLKWKYQTSGMIDGAPAIDENGVIYAGTSFSAGNCYLYAIYQNGTLKWKYRTGGDNIFGSPTIGDDGTIYFGTGGGSPWYGYINAMYPNGTMRWRYETGHEVFSSPAIGDDDTVYCGSHDTYLRALYPNNGTLKWKYKTGDWIRTAPCIADDGTIYVVSLDYFLHAVNPNGTMKWKTNVGAGTSPTIGQDGTIYAGYKALYAINPTNGSAKWTFDVGGTMRGGTPCNSLDGTIYVGTSDGGEIIAVNPNGTERWRKSIGTVECAPAIGEDGTVYIGSNAGYLYAFGRGELEADANGPYYGLIDEPVQFIGSAQGGYSPYTWHWDFGDTYTSDEQNPTHIYSSPGNYTVTLTVTDNTSNSSSDTTWAKIKESNNAPDKPTITGETNGKAGTKYNYVFVSTDSDGDEWVWYYIDWDDGSFEDWIGPYKPGKVVTVGHMWSQKRTYIIRAKARDNYGGESEWATLEVTMPKNQNMWFQQWLDRFPLLQRLLSLPILNSILKVGQ